MDLPYCFVESAEAANEKQRDSTMESRFPAWRPSLFFFLRLVFQLLMVGKCHGNITPVPADVTDAVDDELAEEWMMLLAEFVDKELRPATKAGDASTAASIRESFSQYAGAPEKESGLKLARKGFYGRLG